jgi:hypothetical protein
MLIPLGSSARGRKHGGQTIKTVDEYAGMSFSGRPEVLLHTEVNLPAATAEPATAAGPQCLRFVYFGHSKDAAVELPGDVLPAGRDGELDVMHTIEHESHLSKITVRSYG